MDDTEPVAGEETDDGEPSDDEPEEDDEQPDEETGKVEEKTEDGSDGPHEPPLEPLVYNSRASQSSAKRKRVEGDDLEDDYEGSTAVSDSSAYATGSKSNEGGSLQKRQRTLDDDKRLKYLYRHDCIIFYLYCRH